MISAQDFKAKYKSAKELFEKEKYADALDAFQPLVIYDKNNPYSEHSSFYLGLSAQRLGYTLLAKQTFVQLAKLYPTWINRDEVKYQLACIYFKQGDFFLAIKELNELTDNSLKAEAIRAKQYFVSSIDDIETLTLLLEEFPTDLIIAQQLTKTISANGYDKEYRSLFDSLTKAFEINVSSYPSPESIKQEKKNFRVSLLFPFLLSTLDPTPLKKKNQFVIDFYQGMKLAADSLLGVGITLDIVSYDTERSLDTLRKVLKYEEIKSSDAIIGPLFVEEFKIVNQYSEFNKIPMINPVTNNQEYLGTNDYALLAQPSFATQGTKAAEFVASTKTKKPCAVFYGNSPKDSIMANAFLGKAKQLDIPIKLFEGVTKDTAPKILAVLATPTSYDKWHKPTEFTMKKNAIGCIYMASDNPLIYSKVINAAETRGDSILIIGNESWMKDQSIDFSIYERLSVKLVAPTFTASSNLAFIRFRKKFLELHGSFPSTYDNYAKMGFDFTWFLGHALSSYGSDLINGLKNDEIFKGILSEGYSFRNSNNNQCVPFICFRNGQLALAETE